MSMLAALYSLQSQSTGVDQMWISFKLNSMLWLSFSSGYNQVVES